MTTIKSLKALLKKGTPGPWEWRRDEIVGYEPYTDGSKGKGSYVTIIKTDSRVYPPNDTDAALIMALRNNAKALLAVAEAAEKWSDALGEQHHWRCALRDVEPDVEPMPCDCGYEALVEALAALKEART